MQTIIYVHTADTNPAFRNLQIARCKHLAAREGYHVVLIVADSGGATQQGRPGLQHLRALVASELLDAIILLDYTHLSHQLDEIGAFVAFCRAHHIQIHTVDQWTGVPAERAAGR